MDQAETHSVRLYLRIEFKRPHALAWECIKGRSCVPVCLRGYVPVRVPVSPPVLDAGASGEFRSHTGAWERLLSESWLQLVLMLLHLESIDPFRGSAAPQFIDNLIAYTDFGPLCQLAGRLGLQYCGHIEHGVEDLSGK
jgi:hypothetical protein